MVQGKFVCRNFSAGLALQGINSTDQESWHREPGPACFRQARLPVALKFSNYGLKVIFAKVPANSEVPIP
jgi:hypothetical protein